MIDIAQLAFKRASRIFIKLILGNSHVIFSHYILLNIFYKLFFSTGQMQEDFILKNKQNIS